MPNAWIERLFERMAGFYGSRFADCWRGVDAAVVKRTWAEELAGFSVAEIRRGIDGLRTRDFPPTLPEFLRLCRPPIDPETAFVEAVREMRKRVEDGSDNWTRHEIFWAASTIGFYDLTTTPYPRIEKRWRTALANAKSDPIPVRLVELPRRGDVKANPEHVAKVFADLAAKMGRRPAPRHEPAGQATADEYAAALADIERREAQRTAAEQAKDRPAEAA